MTFFKIMIALMIILIIFELLTRKYKVKYPTILYFGLKGSGKTTFLTKIGIKAIRSGRTVYSNFELPGAILYNPRRLGEFCTEPDSIVLCDEIALVFNNRNYNDFPKCVNEFITLQRKHKTTFIAATQIFDSFDKKIRGQLDQLYQVKRYFRVLIVAHQIIKEIKPTEDGSDINGSYKYAGLIGGLQFCFIPRWVEFFNSFDPPVLPHVYDVRLPISSDVSRHFNTWLWFVDECKDFSKSMWNHVKGTVARFPAPKDPDRQ